MDPVLALSISIAALGGVWTYLALGPLQGFVLVRAGFLAWGAFFHNGGGEKALVKTVTGMAYGALIAWVCFPILTTAPMPTLGAVYPAIVVGATVFLLAIAAGIEHLSAVPANVYGYAALAAYCLQHKATAPATGPLENLLALSFENPLVLIAVLVAAGALSGWLSEQAAKAIGKAAPASA
jgi:hypothetical protein